MTVEALMVDIPAWIAFVGGALALISFIAAAIAVFRQSEFRTSLALAKEANTELRAIVSDLRDEVALEREKRAGMEAKFDFLVDDLADRLVAAVIAATKEQPK